MSDIISLGARRAALADYASDTSPRDMLLDLIAQIDRGELKAEHFIVIAGRVDTDKTTHTQINQAGNFDRYRQVGLLRKGMKIVEDC